MSSEKDLILKVGMRPNENPLSPDQLRTIIKDDVKTILTYGGALTTQGRLLGIGADLNLSALHQAQQKQLENAFFVKGSLHGTVDFSTDIFQGVNPRPQERIYIILPGAISKLGYYEGFINKKTFTIRTADGYDNRIDGVSELFTAFLKRAEIECTGIEVNSLRKYLSEIFSEIARESGIGELPNPTIEAIKKLNEQRYKYGLPLRKIPKKFV